MDINALVTAVLGSGAFTALINQGCNIINRRRERKSGQSEAMRIVLKDRLRQLCVKYIEQGWIYEDELEDLVAMHGCYHDKLKGNGYLDDLIKRVKNLEIRGIGV